MISSFTPVITDKKFLKMMNHQRRAYLISRRNKLSIKLCLVRKAVAFFKHSYYAQGALATTTATAKRTSKKQWVYYAKQQLGTCITLFCTFLFRPCATTTWKCLIASFMEEVNKRQRISFSLSKLECGPHEIISREIRLHLPFSANWNKRDKDCKNGNSF